MMQDMDFNERKIKEYIEKHFGQKDFTIINTKLIKKLKNDKHESAFRRVIGR